MNNQNLTKLLLVDDNRIIRHLLRLTFADSQRFLIFEAENGESALEIAERERPDIIILDVMLHGGINGLEICRRIKSSPIGKQSKIFLLSARTQQDDLEEGVKAGADLYITKPFSPEKLLKSVTPFLVAN